MGKRNARAFITFDAETDPFKHKRLPEPFIWGVYDGLFFQHFDKTEDFVEYLRTQKVIAFGHNAGKYDMMFLLKDINKEQKIMVINGRLVVAHIGECELRDSWNILPVPQAHFADKYEIEDFTIFEKEERDKPDNRLHIMARLESDCIDLWNTIEQFETSFGRHLTQASSAMAQWRVTSGKKTPKSDKEFFADFVKFYHGGRVKPFKTGVIQGPLEIIDINSAYPWAMLSSHPYEIDYTLVKEPSSVKPTSMVTVNCISYGALPLREVGKGIDFPNDEERRTYYVPGHELLAAIETNTVSDVDIIESIDFVNEVSFKPYIDHFYALRKAAKATGDKAGDLFYKLAMNSLYGKFGANPENYGNYICVEMDDLDKHREDGYVFDGMLGEFALLRAPLDEWQENYINVATAASITSQVRAHLWRAIQACDNPIYCDTDSIICSRSNVAQGPNLGEWKLEGIGEVAYIAGKKMYAVKGDFGKDKYGKTIEWKQASKGVKLTPKEIMKVAKGGEVLYMPDAPTFSTQRAPRWTNRRIRMTD